MLTKRLVEEKENLTEAYLNERLKSFSSVLQLEYLERLNKRDTLLPGIRVFVCRKISEIYEAQGLYSLAASALKPAIENIVLFKEKRDTIMKLGLLWLKAGELRDALETFNEALKVESPNEVKNLQNKIRTLCFTEADNFEKKGRTTKAIEIYERMLKNPQEGEDINRVKTRLADFYKKIGKVRESINLMHSI